MPNVSPIQWTDSTINPIMGCNGCELFPAPSEVTQAIDSAVKATGAKIDSKKVIAELINEHYGHIKNPAEGFRNSVTTTNIWHFRELLEKKIWETNGPAAAAAARKAIRRSVTCYAGKLHCNKGLSIVNPERKPNTGHARTFEQVTTFDGRVKKMAAASDLLGQSNENQPWKKALARMIFVSDMGDAFSAKKHFPFLRNDVMAAICSENGKRHLWLWLTKQPETMAAFAKEIDGFPANVCAMTTVTSMATLSRINELRKVKAQCRGLSLEPLWERIPASKINLKGIDWMIVGGESGSGKDTRPFALEWARELRDHCKANGVAFFMKQIGRNAVENGKAYKLPVKRNVASGRFTDAVVNSHGGDWTEWPEDLRIREFPKQFHSYRKRECKPSVNIRPASGKKTVETQLTKKDHDDFKKYDDIVRRGVDSFIECGKALLEIRRRNLWKACCGTWEQYCRTVAGMSKPHAHRLVRATEITLSLRDSLPIGNALPVSESQVRPLQILEEPEKQLEAWNLAVAKSGGQPTAAEVTEAVFEIVPQKASNKESPAARRLRLLAELRQVAKAERSWDDVRKLCFQLEQSA